MPTASLLDPNRKAVARVTLAHESIMLAMQSRPDNNLSATFKNLSLLLEMVEVKFPFSSTSENLFRRLILGILTLLKAIRALSTPFNPSLWPMSSMKTPSQTDLSAFLIFTKKTWIPSYLPFMFNYAKTIE